MSRFKVPHSRRAHSLSVVVREEDSDDGEDVASGGIAGGDGSPAPGGDMMDLDMPPDDPIGTLAEL